MNDWTTEISMGRACVRLAEAADMLLVPGGPDTDVALLRAARQFAVKRLRTLVTELPPDVFAQILVASDKVMAPVGDISMN